MKKTAKPLIRQTYSYKQTKGIMISDEQQAIDAASLAIRRHRKQLDKYVQHNPHFLYSLNPLVSDAGEYVEPRIVEKMLEASKAAGVGPMAAVAGVLATADSGRTERPVWLEDLRAGLSLVISTISVVECIDKAGRRVRAGLRRVTRGSP